jgi:hypothetical protein
MRSSTLILLLVPVSGCIEPVIPLGEGPGVELVRVAHIPPRFNPDLDLLFVVDDSESMMAKQAELAASFERLLAQLEFFEDESGQRLPNLHIGVVSTDMGVGTSFAVAGCQSDGQGGVLQGAPGQVLAPGSWATPLEPGSLELDDPEDLIVERFLRDVAEGEARATNYSGALEDVFASMIQMGNQGCPIEQPLAAMRAALDGSRPENADFVREGAALAVIVLSNEDDCSVADPRFFDPALDSDQPDFRCFARAIQCNDDVVAEGRYSGCRPRQDPEFLHDIAGYRSFLSSLKDDDSLLVTAMAGAGTDAEIVKRTDGSLSVAARCEDSQESYPAVRLQQLVSELKDRGDVAPQCGDQARDAVTATGERIRKMLGTRCMDSGVMDMDPHARGVQPTCNVWMQPSSDPDDRLVERQSLPACEAPPHLREQAEPPCYYIDEGGCGDTLTTQLKLFVWWGLSRDGTWRSQSADMHVFAECLVESPGSFD